MDGDTGDRSTGLEKALFTTHSNDSLLFLLPLLTSYLSSRRTINLDKIMSRYLKTFKASVFPAGTPFLTSNLFEASIILDPI